MSGTPNSQYTQSSGEPSNSGTHEQPTNTSPVAGTSTHVENVSAEASLSFELTEYIESLSPTTEHLRRRRREANMAELKRLFSMSPETTHEELRKWLLENLSVLAHSFFKKVADPSAYVEHNGHYFELNIDSPRGRQITSRILTIVSVTKWEDDDEMRNAIESVRDLDHFAASRKHIIDYSTYHIWKQFASKEFRQAVKQYRSEELARREQRPQSLLRQMELAYPESNDSGSSDAQVASNGE